MDTDTRKYSAVNLSSPWRGVCNIPSGLLDEPEWFSIAHLYNEFAAGEAPPDDTTPDAFSFTDQFGVALSSTITSAPITVTGIDAPADITVSGDASSLYIINGGTPTADPGTVVNGDEVQARHTSSASYLTTVNTVVTIGGVPDTFSSQTQPDPSSSDYRGTGRIGIRLGVGE